MSDIKTEYVIPDFKIYWNRIPGVFLDRRTGKPFDKKLAVFTGTIREWYETLVETINDCFTKSTVSDDQRFAQRFIVVSQNALPILESSVLYHPIMWGRSEGEVIFPFPTRTGTLNLQGDVSVYVDESLDDKVIIVGYKALGGKPKFLGSVIIENIDKT